MQGWILNPCALVRKEISFPVCRIWNQKLNLWRPVGYTAVLAALFAQGVARAAGIISRQLGVRCAPAITPKVIPAVRSVKTSAIPCSARNSIAPYPRCSVFCSGAIGRHASPRSSSAVWKAMSPSWRQAVGPVSPANECKRLALAIAAQIQVKPLLPW